MLTRIPCEQFALGDYVQAVEKGPLGKVIDADRMGWTLVRYPIDYYRRGEGEGVMPYKHGKDRLIPAEDVQMESARRDPRGLGDGCGR